MEGYLRVIEEGDVIRSKLYWAVLEDNYLTFYSNKKDKNASLAINFVGKYVSTQFNPNFNCEIIQVYDNIGNFNMFLSPNESNDFGLWKSNLANTSQTYNSQYDSQNASENFKDSRRISRNSNRDIEGRRSSNHGPTPKPRKSVPSTSYPYNSEYEGHNSPLNTNGYPTEKRNQDRRDSRRSYNNKENPINSAYTSPNRTKYNVDPRRQSNVSNASNNMNKRPYSNYNQRYSRASQAQSITGNTRNIETVKEDPDMQDDEVLTSRPIPSVLDNPRRISIPDSMKRWSIAATDLVGKSVEELYLLLIQLNRHKANLEVWMAHMEQKIELINEELAQNLRSSDREELELEKSKYEEDMEMIQELLEMCDPLIQLLDSVVKMSGVYGGNNQMFHVVYHNEPAVGDEDFTNIEFVRHNQERQVAKLLDDYKAHNQLSLSSDRHETEINDYHGYQNYSDDEYEEQNYNKSNSFVRKSLRQKSARKNRENTLKNLPLNHSDSFVTENRNYTYLLDDIDTSLLKMDSVKTDLQKYMEDGDGKLMSVDTMRSTSSRRVNDTDDDKENYSLDNQQQFSQQYPKTIHSLKLTDSEPVKLNGSVHKPRRSSRKSPKSDMTASLNRLSHYKKTNVPYSDSSLTNDYIRHSLSPAQQKRSSSYSNRNSGFNKPNYVNQDVFQQSDSEIGIQPAIVDHVYANPGTLDHEEYERSSHEKPISNSKIQNRLQDILNTQPYDDNQSKSSKSKHQPIRKDYLSESPKIDPLTNGEPLIKLNMSLYSSKPSLNKGPNSLQSESFSLGANSDQLNSSLYQAPIEGNQRMNLNQVLNDDKMWKNPSRSRAGLDSPGKINIPQRYEPSDVDEMSNYGDEYYNNGVGNYGNQEERSSRIRKIVAAGKGENEELHQYSNGLNYRENQLLQQSLLAKEASRRSREL